LRTVDVDINLQRMTGTYISGPAVARLKGCSLQAVDKLMRRGACGPLLQRGHVRFVALDRVERHSGVAFSPEQIADAVAGRPDRMFVVQLEDA
jgi:hypothetical protein